MFKKLTIIMCLLSFCPAAVGAQELAALQQSAPVAEQSGVVQVAKEVDLSLPAARQAATIMAANDVQGTGVASERPRKTHTGLTFQEFCEVHFGEYRWIYWVGAAAVLVAIHVAAAD
jgi:hypothetical protein